ncbi:MAG TPA: hypothetical protein VHI72_18380, partial [Hyphomicrobiaceae bacterium]|nr:hypothetical protein [Hyphomicrobiaceae bacterium]
MRRPLGAGGHGRPQGGAQSWALLGRSGAQQASPAAREVTKGLSDAKRAGVRPAAAKPTASHALAP